MHLHAAYIRSGSPWKGASGENRTKVSLKTITSLAKAETPGGTFQSFLSSLLLYS